VSMQLPMEQPSREPEFLESTARLRMLSRLAGALAHEFRNPLTTIFLHADILEDALRRLESNQRPQLLHFLQVMREEVGRIDDLIQQYFWLARLPDLERQPEDLGVYIDAFVLEMQAFVEAHGITLEVEGTRGLGQMSLHKHTFRRVLLHLLHNAVEAMPHGGVLRLRGQRLGQQLCLEVSDTGCGILATQLCGLFQPFQMTKAGKLGLGLYVAHEIVTAHDGVIEVCSTPGTGTTVRLTFPACPGSGPT
jgi:two-component system sensor histidine kinase HydH